MLPTAPVKMGEVKEHLAILKSVFAFNPKDLKAATLRRSERSLVILESCLTESFLRDCQSWTNNLNAQAIITQRIHKYHELQEAILELESSIKHLNFQRENWTSLKPETRDKILRYAKLAEKFQDENHHLFDAHLLLKFERFQALRPLMIFSDKAGHLCEALYHHSNRQKYEDSLSKIESKLKSANERLLSTQKGFTLSLILCFFVITLPVCLPFTYSLWKRKREIFFQIADLKELNKREQKRLELAEEGLIAADEIQKTVGKNLDFDEAKALLQEIKSIKSELQLHKDANNLTMVLLDFIDTDKPLLQAVFGETPRSELDTIDWLIQKVSHVLKIETTFNELTKKIQILVKTKEEILNQKKLSELELSLVALIKAQNQLAGQELESLLEMHGFEFFHELSILIKDVRAILSMVSYGYRVDQMKWIACHARLSLKENAISLSEFSMDTLSSESTIPWFESQGPALTQNAESYGD